MRKWALLLLLACGSAGAAGLFGPNVNAVKGRLTDPYSAKFEDVRRAANGAVCGQFNAKNEFGAYAGRKEFAIIDGAAFIEGYEGEEDAIILYCIRGDHCKDAACLDGVKQQIDREARSAAVAPEIGAMRGQAAAVCRKHTESAPGTMIECSNALVECRKQRFAIDEAECLSEAASRYE